jgi:signal transduction histidine kinase
MNALRKSTVLVVDDEQNIVDDIAFRFESEGFDVLKASGGVEALQLVRSFSPDLVVTDLRMPHGTGEDFIRQMGRNTNETPVIFCMTGYADLSLEHAYDLGVDAVFSKPFKLSDMIGATRHFLSIKKALKDAAIEKSEYNAKLVETAKLCTLGEMVSGIIHEINNPLAMISWKSEQLKEALQDEHLNPPIAREFANQICESTSQISKIIRGVRTLSMTGNIDNKVNVRVQNIIDDASEILKHRFRNLRAELIIEITDPTLTLTCNATQMVQVLVNLMNNAIEAIEDIPERWVKVTAYEQGRELIIQVCDSGKGIPPDIRGKLMERFFTTKQARQGTGLGLNISKSIIERHQGTLELDTENKNTCFIIRLPH